MRRWLVVLSILTSLPSGAWAQTAVLSLSQRFLSPRGMTGPQEIHELADGTIAIRYYSKGLTFHDRNGNIKADYRAVTGCSARGRYPGFALESVAHDSDVILACDDQRIIAVRSNGQVIQSAPLPAGESVVGLRGLDAGHFIEVSAVMSGNHFGWQTRVRVRNWDFSVAQELAVPGMLLHMPERLAGGGWVMLSMVAWKQSAAFFFGPGGDLITQVDTSGFGNRWQLPVHLRRYPVLQTDAGFTFYDETGKPVRSVALRVDQFVPFFSQLSSGRYAIQDGLGAVHVFNSDGTLERMASALTGDPNWIWPFETEGAEFGFYRFGRVAFVNDRGDFMGEVRMPGKRPMVEEILGIPGQAGTYLASTREFGSSDWSSIQLLNSRGELGSGLALEVPRPTRPLVTRDGSLIVVAGGGGPNTSYGWFPFSQIAFVEIR